MTNLSQQAQAVLDAAMNTPEECPYEYDIAFALEAAADQVVPANGSRRNNEIRAELLAIAAELRGESTTKSQ